MAVAKNIPIFRLHRAEKDLRHSQQGGPLDHPIQDLLSRQNSESHMSAQSAISVFSVTKVCNFCDICNFCDFDNSVSYSQVKKRMHF